MLPSVPARCSPLDAARGVTDNFPYRSVGRSIALEERRDDVLRGVDALRLEVEELRASRRRLAMTADAERRSIERELHEGVQQLLVALAANLELAATSFDAAPASAKELLVEIAEDTRQALEETRKLAERIYPPLLEAGGLVAALRGAAANADVPTTIDVAAGTTCPPEIAGAVYFCCLDALERAAAGTTVAISVRNEEGAVAFELVAVGDLDADGLPVRDRVEALGGRLTITEGSGGKISVAGSLPLSG
jgi:signal transduction histidine kinase